MNALSLVLVELIALLAIMELFVICMPTALRLASEQNCYRMDGTRSSHRTYRESRAKNRLRGDMLGLLALVFLCGNAFYFAVDSVAPVRNIANRLSNEVSGDSLSPQIKIHQDQVVARDQKGKPISDAQFNRYWPLLVVGFLCWALVSFLFVGWGAQRGYKNFAEGVRSRSAEHLQRDMTRISLEDSPFLGEPVASQDANQGAA